MRTVQIGPDLKLLRIDKIGGEIAYLSMCLGSSKTFLLLISPKKSSLIVRKQQCIKGKLNHLSQLIVR